MNQSFQILIGILIALSSVINSSATSFPKVGATPGFVYNDSIAGTLVTYRNDCKASNSAKSLGGVTSVVYTEGEDVYINGILSMQPEDDFYGHYPYILWHKAKIGADSNSFLLPNNTFIKGYTSWTHTHYGQSEYYVCLVTIHPGNKVEEVAACEYIEFQVSEDGSVTPKFNDTDGSFKYALAIKCHTSSDDIDSTTGNVIGSHESTTYTPYEELVMNPVEILPPADLEWTDMKLQYDYYSYGPTYFQSETNTKVAISGDNVYILLINQDYDWDPDRLSSIKGEIKGNKIEISDHQITGLPYSMKEPHIAGMVPKFTYSQLITVETEIVETFHNSYRLESTLLNWPLNYEYNPETQFIGKANFSFGIEDFHNLGYPKYYLNSQYNAAYSGIDDIKSDAIISSDSSSAPYYNIYGVRFDSRPTLPGLYIHNGKRILIK